MTPFDRRANEGRIATNAERALLAPKLNARRGAVMSAKLTDDTRRFPRGSLIDVAIACCALTIASESDQFSGRSSGAHHNVTTISSSRAG